tara:strand:+ start:535 stop:675 length:141 start_codon:yes stop_codon:yes gene_type:complete
MILWNLNERKLDTRADVAGSVLDIIYRVKYTVRKERNRESDVGLRN